MSDALLQALIVGGGAFIGSILGNVVRPVLDHYLRRRAQRADDARTTARDQFDHIYRPIYDMFQNGLPPDLPFEDAVTSDMRDRVVELVNKNRPLAEPALEHSVSVIEETAWTAGGAVDTAELLKVWNHIYRKYNALKRELGYPYTRWWHVLSPRRLYRRIWWRWHEFTMARMLKRTRATEGGNRMFWWSVAIAAAAIYLQRYVYPLVVVAVADVGLYWFYYREKWSWKALDRLAMLFVINVLIYFALNWAVRRWGFV